MQQLIELLERYKTEMKRYPDKLSELYGFQNEGEREAIGKTDPWNNDYYYKYPGDYGEYDLASWGANKEQEKADTESKKSEYADITSWAEASLISTWYEYTPTSALDIDLKLRSSGE